MWIFDNFIWPKDIKIASRSWKSCAKGDIFINPTYIRMDQSKEGASWPESGLVGCQC